jgi:hypothetical protein
MDPTVGDDFIAFCLDLGQTLASPATYMVKTLSETGFGAAVTNTIDRLFTAHYASLGTDATNNAAFQLALWEIIDETSGTYDVTTGSFSATSSATGLANTFLDTLGNATGGYTITFYESGTSQDLVGASPIPLPAGAPLLLTGIAGFAWMRRRKAKKA